MRNMIKFNDPNIHLVLQESNSWFFATSKINVWE